MFESQFHKKNVKISVSQIEMHIKRIIDCCDDAATPFIKYFPPSSHKLQLQFYKLMVKLDFHKD